MTPFISVITVCYNNELTVQRTMNAIAGQTFKDFEYIFVANGCKDKSRELAYSFKDAHPELNMRIVEIEVNEGLAKGRNAGLDAATGKYVIFNDADDWMEPNCLELLAAKAKEGGYDRVHATARSTGIGEVPRFEYKRLPKNKYAFSALLQAHLLSRKVLEENTIRFSDVFIDDTVFYFKVLKCAKSIEIVSECVYNIDDSRISNCKSELNAQMFQKERASMYESAKALAEISSNSDSEFLQIVEAAAFFVFISCIRTSLSIDNDVRISAKHAYLWKELTQFFPKVLKSKYLKLSEFHNFESRSAHLTYVFAWLERIHLIVPALWMFQKLVLKKK